jgi:hypothetical protein
MLCGDAPQDQRHRLGATAAGVGPRNDDLPLEGASLLLMGGWSRRVVRAATVRHTDTTHPCGVAWV